MKNFIKRVKVIQNELKELYDSTDVISITPNYVQIYKLCNFLKITEGSKVKVEDGNRSDGEPEYHLTATVNGIVFITVAYEDEMDEFSDFMEWTWVI